MRRLVLLLLTLAPSWLRVRVLRAMGHTIGRNCRISPLAVLVADKIEIGNDTLIAPLAVIFNLAAFRVGRGTIISYLGLIYASTAKGHFRAGDRYAMGMLAMIDCSAGVDMGDACSVGPRSILYTHANAMPTVQGYTSTYAGITLGDRVWLMMDVKVMPGVTIASDVHVAPTSFVPRAIKKSGLFMNAFMAEKDLLMPLPPARRQSVDAAFLDQWLARAFDDLPEFARGYFDREVTVVREPWGWWLDERGRRLQVVDGRSGRPPAPASSGPRLVLCHGAPPTDRTVAYIDCERLAYRGLERLGNKALLKLYFFAIHGMSIAEVDDR
ncbi:MAG: acyltransferase [Hyphomicrobiaceae bacterium]